MIKWSYFQYRKAHGYPIYLRFNQEELNPKFLHLLKEIGFGELSENEAKKIPLQRPHTRVLTAQIANARLQLMLHGSDLLDQYGPESLSLQAGVPVYTYRKVGMVAMPSNKNLWDLALHQDISHTEQMIGLRILLTRFLAQALSPMGVLTYWGTVKDDTVIIMKQGQSFGEAVLIDTSKKLVFSNGGEMRFSSLIKILRKDKESKSSLMSREDLISFLSVSTCLLSFSGISGAMKKSIYDLSTISSASYAISENTTNL